MPSIPPLLPLASDTPMVKPMFRTLGIAASGLSAQRARLEVTAMNLANAETTHGPDGKPYQRKIATLVERPLEQRSFVSPDVSRPLITMPGEIPATVQPPQFKLAPRHPVEAANGVAITGVAEDQTQGPLVYDPGHPDANKDGYVRYPNVRITDEMVNLMDARRIYEANATVFQSAKQMLKKALDI
jgi:flagellar basal-body rod protein FlgC